MIHISWHGNCLYKKWQEKWGEIGDRDNSYDSWELADLLGGSPSNVASLNLKKGRKFHALTGVNLPMLLEALINREGKSLEELVEACIEAGKTGINHINKVLSSM